MAKKTTSKKLFPTFPVKIALTFKKGSPFLTVTAFNKEHLIPVKRINFEELLNLSLENAQGFICFWNTNVYYANHPTIFNFEDFTFDLLHDDFDSYHTIACLSQVAFYSTFSHKLVDRNVECESDRNYSLRLTMKQTAYTYAEIQREKGQNPHQPRSCIIFRESKKIKNQERVYPLQEVSRKDLLGLRYSKKPGLVLKKDNKLLYTSVPKELDITLHNSSDDAQHHLCSNCVHVCQGCPRTRDQAVSFQLKYDDNFQHAVLNSWRPEKYRFMHEAIETFNMATCCESLVVLKCNMHSSSN